MMGMAGMGMQGMGMYGMYGMGYESQLHFVLSFCDCLLFLTCWTLPEHYEEVPLGQPVGCHDV